MVKLELNLPWKPVLAWPWGVTYLIEPESNLVTSHVESWDIEPLEVRVKAYHPIFVYPLEIFLPQFQEFVCVVCHIIMQMVGSFTNFPKAYRKN